MKTAFFNIFLLCLLLLPVAIVQAQYEENNFIHYTTKEGMTDNYITSIQQDGQDYIWVGTVAGLNRFDGNNFSAYRSGSGSIPLLAGKIKKLKYLQKNKLAVINSSGTQVLNTTDLSMKDFLVPSTGPLSYYSNYGGDCNGEPDNNFVITTSAGFYCFDNSAQIIFRHDGRVENDIGKKKMVYGREIFKVSPDEYLLYVNDYALAYYNAAQKQFTDIDDKDPKWRIFCGPLNENAPKWMVKYQLSDHEFIFMQRDKDSITYYDHATEKIVTSATSFHCDEFNYESFIYRIDQQRFAINSGANGFYIFHLDPQTGKISSNDEKILPSYKVNCVFADREGRLWAGTSEGLLQQRMSTPFLKTFTYAPGMITDDLFSYFSALFRYKDKLYAGRYSKDYGLVVLDTATMLPLKKICFFEKESKWNEVLSIQQYHPDTLWLGTNAGILWVDTKSYRYGKIDNTVKHEHGTVYFICLKPVDKYGHAWFYYHLRGMAGYYDVASRQFSIFSEDTKPAIPFSKIKSIVYDAYGNTWIGGHALARWNEQLHRFDTLITVYGGEKKFNNDMTCLQADKHGSLWLHNEENYLLQYDINKRSFTNYAGSDGLPVNVYDCFSPVLNDKLWMVGGPYLIRFDTRSHTSIIYDDHDGLPLKQPTTREIYADTIAGFLYITYKNDIARFPIVASAEKDNPPLLLQQLVINNRATIFNPTNDIKLKTGENNLSFRFTSVDFENNDKYQFFYQLNNDSRWNHLGEQRSIILTDLPPGKYTLRLKAVSKRSKENLLEFHFSIAPPFWKTTWFILSAGLLLAAIAFLLYRYRIRQVREKANLDKLLSQSEMKALHAQMNPHFVFNSLNSISEMILNNENKDASHYLSKFGYLIRSTLDQSGKVFVSLRDTMDYLLRYIEMEQIRNNHFSFKMETAAELDMDEVLLPPMLIQPFIENAIWHGVTENRKDIHIRVDFKKEGEQLVCIIDDDGVGINEAQKNNQGSHNRHHAVGIANIQNRIRLLNEKHNLQCSVVIHDKKDLPGSSETGTLVTLRLPLEIKEE